jgi:Flp pilus assembly protein TadD
MTMKTRTMFSIGLSAFVLTGATVGASTWGMTASAASAENPKQAASQADKARKAIAKRQADKAVQFAESAVAFAPQDAEYRALLGQAYLLAGRFTSAKQALDDSLTLEPNNPRVALNYTLAQIAQGDWAGARATLDAHDDIGASDRGLAYALAGDPVKAVQILEPAARESDANAKTRQNYALSLALAGRWAEAKTVAAIDMAPDQVDARIMQWASFSRPTNAYDQVASLLGVTAVQDAGQPVGLALVRPAGNVGVAAAEQVQAAPVDAYMPSAPATAEAAVVEAPVQTAAVESAPVAPEVVAEPVQVAGTGPSVVFGPRTEIVQSVPATVAKPVRAAKVPVTAPVRAVAKVQAPSAPMAKGKFYVQLGAYANPAVARDAWRRTAARVPAVGKHSPQGANVTTKAGNFYRLSVGGFARNDADSLCRQVKSSGGICFVRVAAGDQVASWGRNNGTQVASR